ncbi:hypothetical protein L3049_03935 [Labilibaculum sp. DW002]|uniref:Uncharacterized protein n=1 Tax=Paralabilibaculum antarcticum TaxID=2912572 RepID=A0ABT5VS71_9BACT|nr:hypothetical protein [Labilibaculum sp. DW002]MDE5417149.1 hypothetical protein [Labilibaculum sp. DW002]
MKYTIITVLLLLFFNVNIGYTQCRDFAKEICKPKLQNYAHDGNYNGAFLNEEEEVEIHKAFFVGQKYRIVVGKEENLPTIHFQVKDTDNNLLFDNQESAYVDFYDFTLETSKTLVISIRFVKDEDPEKNLENGCISILFGIEL